MQLAALDWIILAILLLSMAIGAWRGLVYEVLSVLGWLAAFIIAQLYAATVGNLLPMAGATDALRYAAGFVLTFIASAFAAGLLAWLAKKLIETVGLRPVDRTLGAFFGLLRGAVILMAATTAVLMTPLKEGDWWKQSSGAGLLSATLRAVKPILPNEVGQYISAKALGASREI
ncbi:CvpA family protein [Variovorax sp. PCZ-1]|uniref:CvpA family protein n=1 Tax=Variovorax sp. PCZ-1 TaxID=2835533 RepID=UPI001BCBC4CB|nr:CvpA family protein [Variovorax sp. PCZ-1]MBS7806558.1 CvpA family protein [Variovorax sp. PCZ-1]